MRCQHCPIASGACPGETAPRLCDLIDPAHPDYRPETVDSILATAEQLRAQPPASAVPVPAALDLARRMRGCPYRSTDPGCGCSGGRCALRRGAIVSHRDCFACLERYD